MLRRRAEASKNSFAVQAGEASFVEILEAGVRDSTKVLSHIRFQV